MELKPNYKTVFKLTTNQKQNNKITVGKTVAGLVPLRKIKIILITSLKQ